MVIGRILSLFVILFTLISCSASYEELINSNFDPKDEFSKHLLKAYKEKAKFEAIEMHDWNSAKLYSEKALRAVNGERILPQHISYWKIPEDKTSDNLDQNHLDLIKAYNNLMIIYNEALILDPFNLAKAIASLDCWSEQQEENWQTWDINKCRDDYLEAMHFLYNAISEIKNKKLTNVSSDSKKDKKNTSIVTQNNNEDILQIIYFDFDKSELSNINIGEIKSFIKKNKDNIKKYIVIGHTDTKGSDEYNLILSVERAKVVKKILIDLGINTADIKIVGEGEKDLRIKTDDEIAHPANRRAEISPLN